MIESRPLPEFLELVADQIDEALRIEDECHRAGCLVGTCMALRMRADLERKGL